jgi:hypothetical protein
MSRDTLVLLGGVVSTVLAAATLPGTIELLLLTTGGLLRGARRRLGDGSGVMHTRGHAGAAMEITTLFRLAVVVPAHNEEAVIQPIWRGSSENRRADNDRHRPAM